MFRSLVRTIVTDVLLSAVVSSVISLYYRVLLQIDPTDTNWKVGYTLLWT
jgi:hypothetical protein